MIWHKAEHGAFVSAASAALTKRSLRRQEQPRSAARTVRIADAAFTKPQEGACSDADSDPINASEPPRPVRHV
jgi:hypothetical protein